MTKEEFLKRAANAYDMGLCKPEIIRHASRMIDALHRLEGNQFQYFMDFMVAEQERTQHFSNHMQLANDQLGYSCIQLMAIFTHHCQICAEDPEAWHTRSGFCPHK